MYTIDRKQLIYVGTPTDAGAHIPTELFEQAIAKCIKAVAEHKAEYIYYQIRNWLGKQGLSSFTADRLASFCWLYFYANNTE